MAISKANKIISLLKEVSKFKINLSQYTQPFKMDSDLVFSESSLLSFLNISPGKSLFVHILNTTHLSLLKSYIPFLDVITIRIIAKQSGHLFALSRNYISTYVLGQWVLLLNFGPDSYES